MSHEREECVVVMVGGGGGGLPGERLAETVRSVSGVILEREEEAGHLVSGLESTASGCLDPRPQVKRK